MNLIQSRFWSSLTIALMLAASMSSSAQAKKNSQADQDEETVPTAAIYGMAGEGYVLYGTGGITVSETPRPGMWHSNLKTYKICIDGSAVTAPGASASSFTVVRPDADFYAIANFAYFVPQSATCTLPTANAVAGKEIVVCNASSNGTVTYNTANAETISGIQPGALINSTPYKVDRFISDGKNWYRE